MITQPLALGTLTPYAIILSGCAALGIFLSRVLSKHEYDYLINGGIGLVTLSLLGSRLVYVLFNLSHYLEAPLEIPQIWQGGLSWPGAVLGAALGVYLIRLIWKEPTGIILDSYLPLLGTLALGIWLAGWGAGIGYGPETDSWIGIPVRDIFGVRVYRWPLPLIGAFLSSAWIAGAMLFPLRRTARPGTRGLLGAAGLLAVNAAISFFRVDPAPRLLALRWESWISLVLLAGAAAGVYYLTKDEPDHETAAS